MYIRNLIVEVTRKCNMYCDHCLRGEPINVNMKKEYIDTLLGQVSGIGSVVFTGGEPSLNVPIMEYFLEQCKEKNISIESFYIATNGLKIKENFVLFCLKLYSYCDEKEMCQVQVSNDYFHKTQGKYDISLLSGLGFFEKKNENDDYNYGRYAFLKTQGRWGGKDNDPIVIDEDRITSEDFEDEIEVYLNCKGEIINGCDWSYESQKEHKLCHVRDLDLYYKNLQMIKLGVD